MNASSSNVRCGVFAIYCFQMWITISCTLEFGDNDTAPAEGDGPVVFAEVAAEDAAGVLEPACFLGAIMNAERGILGRVYGRIDYGEVINDLRRKRFGEMTKSAAGIDRYEAVKPRVYLNLRRRAPRRGPSSSLAHVILFDCD